VCKFTSSLFFVARLFLIGFLISVLFYYSSLFDRDGFDVSAVDKMDGHHELISIDLWIAPGAPPSL